MSFDGNERMCYVFMGECRCPAFLRVIHGRKTRLRAVPVGDLLPGADLVMPSSSFLYDYVSIILL